MQLLAALADQLQDRSLAEVSVADVADAAGLGRSAFYFYFAGKQEAVRQLLAGLFEEVTGAVSQIVEGATDPRQAIAAALALDFASWREHRQLFLAMLDARDGDTQTRAIWEAWLTRYEDFLAGYIDRNRIVDGADAQVLAHSLISMNERVLERHLRACGDDEQAAELLAATVHVWQASIFGVAP